jgi:hypothetical protein
MRVWFAVQVAAAHGAEAGAVRTAEDLVRQGQDQRVPRPGGHVEPTVDEVWRGQLVGVGARRLVLTEGEGLLEHSVAETPHARPVQANRQPELEHPPGRRARDSQLGRNLLGNRDVALAAELDRRDRNVDRLPVLLA